MTAGPFCIRKAILIHEPINADTRGSACAAPPLLFGCLFLRLCPPSNPSGKNRCDVPVLIRGGGINTAPKLMAEIMEGQWEVALGPPMPASYRGALHQRLPIRLLWGQPLCFWDNQTTRRPRPACSICSNGLHIDHNNPENGVIIFSTCRYRGLCCVVDGRLCQIYISVISHNGKISGFTCRPSAFLLKCCLF